MPKEYDEVLLYHYTEVSVFFLEVPSDFGNNTKFMLRQSYTS